MSNKKFEAPEIECCEFTVAARLDGSGDSFVPNFVGGSTHNNGAHTVCSVTASNGVNGCNGPSLKNSTGGSGKGSC